jgi:hypothetical protein
MKIEDFVTEWSTFNTNNAVQHLNIEQRLELFQQWSTLRKDIAKADYIGRKLLEGFIGVVESALKQIEDSALSSVPGSEDVTAELRKALDAAIKAHQKQYPENDGGSN